MVELPWIYLVQFSLVQFIFGSSKPWSLKKDQKKNPIRKRVKWSEESLNQSKQPTIVPTSKTQTMNLFLPSFLPQSAEIGQVKRRMPKQSTNGVLTQYLFTLGYNVFNLFLFFGVEKSWRLEEKTKTQQARETKNGVRRINHVKKGWS